MDSLSERGFKWGFYVCPGVSIHGDVGMGGVVRAAKAAGYNIKTAMIVGDTQVASKAFYDVAKNFAANGIKVVGQETWAVGTLTDATPIMSKIKSINPDIVVANPTSITEAQTFLMKKENLV